jgi:lipopolysaccharide export system permease protein
MNLRPRLHDWLVVRAVFGALALTWAVLLGFDLIIAFAEELDSVGQSYSTSHALLYVLATTPRRAYTDFPTAALIGSLLGMGGLAATSELTALRALGLSRWRICIGAVVGLAAVTGLMVIDAETLGPLGEQTAESIAISAKSSDLAVARGSGLWARDGNAVINARSGMQKFQNGERLVQLSDLRLFQFDGNGVLQMLTEAKHAENRSGKWTLTGVTHTHFSPLAVKVDTATSEPWPSKLRPEVVVAGIAPPRYQSAVTLSRNIDYMRGNGVDAFDYQSAYWARWFYPLNVLALCLAALPFAFGQLRSGGMGKRLFIGIVFGLVYFVLQKLATDLSNIYRFPVWLAQVAPPILVLAASRLYFRRRV